MEVARPTHRSPPTAATPGNVEVEAVERTCGALTAGQAREVAAALLAAAEKPESLSVEVIR
jgi:hypothetical protein